MITDENALKILDRLLVKSRANQVHWQLNDRQVESLEDATSFVVTLPESSVQIDFESPSADPDRLIVSFNNKNGVRVKRLVIDEEHPSWSTAMSLYDEAGRVTLGWDKVFNDLENAVKGEKPIGTKPEPPLVNPPGRFY